MEKIHHFEWISELIFDGARMEPQVLHRLIASCIAHQINANLWWCATPLMRRNKLGEDVFVEFR